MKTLSSGLKGDTQEKNIVIGKVFNGNTQIWSESKISSQTYLFQKQANIT